MQLPKCLLVHLATCYRPLNPRETFGDERCGLMAQLPTLSTLSASASHPETRRNPGPAPLVRLSGFPGCLFMEKPRAIQWNIIRRLRDEEDVSCKERLDLFSLKRKARVNLIAACTYSEDSCKDY